MTPRYVCSASIIVAMLTSSGMRAVVSKVALEYIPPFPFAAMRVSIALPFLWGFSRVVETGRIPFSFKHCLAIVGLGLVGVTLPQGLIFVGIHRVGPEIVAIMQPTIPVLVVLLTSALGYEKLTMWKSLGVVSSVGGAVVMLDVSHIELHSSKSVGMLVMFVQVLSYAVFITALSRYLKHAPVPFTVCFWVSTCGSLGLAAVAVKDFPSIDWGSIPGFAWACLLYAAIGVSFLAHGSISWAVNHVPPSVPSLYTCFQPLAATILSAIVYGDTLQLHHAVGMILILGGLFITVAAQRAETKLNAFTPSSPCGSDKPSSLDHQLSALRSTHTDSLYASESDEQDSDTDALLCIADPRVEG